MKKPYRHFDLPTKHLTGERHYVPPKSRDADEIERRRSLPAGTILAEQQRSGTKIAAHILQTVREQHDVRFASRIIAASGLNSAWYGFARGSNVMRRRLHLPFLVQSEEERLWTPDIQERALIAFNEAAVAAEGLVVAVANRAPKQEERRVKVGRMMGDASLELACVGLGETPRYVTPSTLR